MPELEQQLRLLAAEVAYPPTPALAQLVRQRLAAGAPSPRRVIPVRRLVLGFAGVAIAVAAALLVSPQARTTVLGWLGIKGVLIQPLRKLPTPSPRGGDLAQRLDLGTPLAFAEAEKRVAYHILVPQLLGSADRVFLREPPLDGEISLVYSPRTGLPVTKETGVGLLLMELRGDINPDFLGKLLGPDTTVQVVDVNGSPGYWIAGAPHGFFYNDASGNGSEEAFRLAGNTLLWEQGGLTLRIESALTREEALAIARTIR